LLPMTTERKILMTLEKEQIINALEVWHQNYRRRLYENV
jgi:hypothetical protein